MLTVYAGYVIDGIIIILIGYALGLIYISYPLLKYNVEKKGRY